MFEEKFVILRKSRFAIYGDNLRGKLYGIAVGRVVIKLKDDDKQRRDC